MSIGTDYSVLLKELKTLRLGFLEGAERRLDGRKDGRTIVKYISASVDGVLAEGWSHFSEEARSLVDVVAIGGYGRSELCPFSDWDLLFLVPERCGKAVLAEVSKYAQLIWDIGGNLGHSVRTLKEAQEFFNIDHHARTAFLESRLVVGEGELYKKLNASESAGNWDSRRRAQFCREKIDECFDRRLKLGNTAFCMEPDCKNGKGALRDVSTIFWLSMVWYQVPAARQLISDGVVSDEEFNAFVKARDFLWRVRSGLHLISGREHDRLIFEYQAALANRFRYRNNVDNGAVERFLKKYFLNVRTIADLSDIFLLHFKELVEPSKIGPKKKAGPYGFVIQGDMIEIASESDFLSDPLNLLRIFKEAQDNRCGLGSKVLRLVRKYARLLSGPIRLKKEAGAIFLDILRSPEGVTKNLRQMHETGVLGQFCPDFRRITGHGQFDRYHHYTVDAHTIAAASFLRELSLTSSGNASMIFVSSLLKKLERPELLYIAVIYHDIAKGRGGDHSEIGAELAKKFSIRVGISDHDSDFVAWLVLHHLRLSKTAQHYDLNDLNVIADFSKFIGDRQHLVYLFLLTVVDVAAVGPGTLTDWKLHLFVQLFQATDDFLRTGRVDLSNQADRIAARKNAALLLAAPSERIAIAKIMDMLSRTLSLHLSPELILAVCRLLEEESGVDIKLEEEKGYTRILTWGLDRKGLLASLAAALARSNVKIITAHAYTLRDGRVLDEFHVTSSRDIPIREKSHLDRVKSLLLTALSEEGILEIDEQTISPDILMKSLPTSVRPHPSAAHDVTAIEVVAADRKGLLATLSGVVADSGFILRGANISTFGEKAVDVFFVTDEQGSKLSGNDTSMLVHELDKVAQLEP